MKKTPFLIMTFVIMSAFSYAQSYNAKENSHRGYDNVYTQQKYHSAWSGSGVAIGSNLFATNNHVVAGASHLYIYVSESQKRYKAETIAVDETNDLAIVKVVDTSFPGFPIIKYGFKKENEDVGTNVFVLGYPMIETMGEEIKLTTGVVSSRSGYQGDKSQYQISAPVQPGNSGGPIFNERGELIGIISAKYIGADNVSYGVKFSYLDNLASRCNIAVDFDKASQISPLSLSEKCKAVIPCTIIVLADNDAEQSYSSQIITPSPESAPNSYNDNSSYKQSVAYPIHCDMPAISRKGNNGVEIYAIEITQKHTAVYMSWTNSNNNSGWYNIQKDTYIVDRSSGKKYTLLNTDNCAIAPKRSAVGAYDTEDFVLYFPSLPSSVSSIDLCEPNTTSSWKFYGIKVQ